MELAELRGWCGSTSRTVHLFCDASGTPPYLGAVLFIDACCYFTHMEAPSEILSWFKRRNEQQIMGLELLSILLGDAFQVVAS